MIHTIQKKKSLKSLVLLTLCLSMPLMATGPRITQTLITPDKKEIFALDLPPFISTEVKGGGILHEIVDAAFKEAKVDVAVTTLPLQSMVTYYLRQEKAFGVMGRHLGLKKKEKKSLISIPLYVAAENYLYYKPLHPKGLAWQGKLSKLKGLTYGASKGESTKVYKNAGISVKKGRTLSLFKKLKSGAVDFIGIPKESAEWFLEKKFKKDKNHFAVMKRVTSPVTVTLRFNPKHAKGKASAKAFKKGLRAIIKNGSYAAILGKYLKDSAAVKAQEKRLRTFLK